MINKKYLSSQAVQNLYAHYKGCNPVRFLLWEDFIDSEVYNEIEKEIFSQNLTPFATHKDTFIHHHVNYLRGQYLKKLSDFFQGEGFSKYLSLYLEEHVHAEYTINQEDITKKIGDTHEGIIAHMYKQGDFSDWHIDGVLKDGILGSCMYYLGGYGGEWEVGNGGNLEFGMQGSSGAGDIDTYYRIPYKKNTLIFIFSSHIAFHRVSPMMYEIPRLSVHSTIFKK